MTLALIIARGGSVRLPRKNVLPLCGHPLIAWSIRQAMCSKEIDMTVMATDDDEIESISREYGVDDVIRHPEWGSDANRTFVWALDDLKSRYLTVDLVVTMIPPAPLRLPGDLDRLVCDYHRVGAHVQTFMARPTEMALYEDRGLGLCRSVYTEPQMKHKKHLLNVLGATARAPGFIAHYEIKLHESDDPDVKHRSNAEYFYTEAKPWQIYETDTAEDFELCEVLMEHFILKGNGMEVYNEYARSAESA